MDCNTAENGTSQGTSSKDCLSELVVHDVSGIVVVHGDLLENHSALRLEVGASDGGGGHHVNDNIDGNRQIRVEHTRVVARELFGRECVDLAAAAVNGRRNVERAATTGSLEEQVLEVVSRSRLSADSSREPTPTQRPKATDRTVGTSSVTILSPLGRTVRLTMLPSCPRCRIRVLLRAVATFRRLR